MRPRASRSAARGTVASIGIRHGVAPSLHHCVHLMGPRGITQFARGAVADPASGTCLDDNARLLIAAVLALRLDASSEAAAAMAETALSFIELAQSSDGLFANLMDERGAFFGDISHAAVGRAIWACGIAAAFSDAWHDRLMPVVARSLQVLEQLDSPHGRAYAALGLSAVLQTEDERRVHLVNGRVRLRERMRQVLTRLAFGLEKKYHETAVVAWPWWYEEMTWGCARLPEALLRAGTVLQSERCVRTGLQALAFLDSVTSVDGVFAPIGNDGWCRKGATAARYDQQPLEACGMVDAWLAAHAATGLEIYRHRAGRAFGWFLGCNTERLAVADVTSGGCHDGLAPGALNPNMGAESTLSYVHAHAAVTLAYA